MDMEVTQQCNDYHNLDQVALDKAIAEAAKNYDVVQGTSNTLLLDLDTAEAKAQYDRVFPILAANFALVDGTSWKSKSGNLHVLITLREEMPLGVRLALQAALGSDGVREVLSVKSMLKGVIEPSVLFKPRV